MVMLVPIASPAAIAGRSRTAAKIAVNNRSGSAPGEHQ
jgi:hypothetical protein